MKLPDFTALSKQIAAVTPKSTAMADYKVTNTAAQACPPTGTSWAAASALPPIANADLCSCMVSSLSCVPNSGLSGNATAELFSTVCGLSKKACEGINANATTGVYGAYSMCSATQKLSFAFDQYYKIQNKASTACSFGGKAKIVSPSVSSSCEPLINQAGVEGTGTVTTAPTGTGSASGASSSGTDKKDSAGSIVRAPLSDSGTLQLGLYVLVAGITGLGMMLL